MKIHQFYYFALALFTFVDANATLFFLSTVVTFLPGIDQLLQAVLAVEGYHFSDVVRFENGLF